MEICKFDCSPRISFHFVKNRVCSIPKIVDKWKSVNFFYVINDAGAIKLVLFATGEMR